jgi:hypothetical protein
MLRDRDGIPWTVAVDDLAAAAAGAWAVVRLLTSPREA